MNGDSIAGYTDIVTGRSDMPDAPDGGARIPSASSPELKSLLGIAVAAISVAALYFAQEVLIPITLAVMLSFVLSPVVNLLQRVRLWRAPAVMLTVLAALGVVGLIGTLIGSQAAALSANAPQYAQTIEAKVEGVQSFAVAKVAAISKAIGPSKPVRAAPSPKHPPTLTSGAAASSSSSSTTSSSTQAGPKPVLVKMADQQTSPLTVAKTILAPILGPLGTTFIVLVVAIFILMQKEDLRDRFIRLFGSHDLHRTTLAMDDAGKRLSKYFLSQLAVNTSFGVVIGLGLWLIGIPSPAMWGILAGLLRFVPYIGSALAALAPMALGAAIDPGWSSTISVAALFLIVEPLTGYVVEPMLYGHSTGLSPVSVIVSAVFWTWLWGPIGLIMSTPLTLCLVVMGRHVKSLEFFDVMLGDRPALTPVESFYQRILANNPDEALAQAEALLADRPLVDYYDGVVLQGLKLAADDEARGTIDRVRAVAMTKSMLSVIGDLDDHVDTGDADGATDRPESPTGPQGTIACIAGRGPFDDAVSTMLAQLLTQRQVDTRVVSNAMVSREAIGSLDLRGVDVVAISYLELAGSPAHLRYLIKRLRQRAPNLKIIVGLWPKGEAVLTDTAIQRAVGADVYVGSLRAATEAALAQLAAERSVAAAH
jgi:predicted PurR-regulated permease PerM